MFCMMLGILTLPVKLLKEPSTGTFDLFLYIFFDFVEFLYVVSFIYIACQEFRPLSPAPTVSLHSVLVLLLSTLIVDEDINLVFQPLQYSNGSIFPLMDQNQNLIPTAKNNLHINAETVERVNHYLFPQNFLEFLNNISIITIITFPHLNYFFYKFECLY